MQEERFQRDRHQCRLAHLTAGRVSRGHRTLAPEPVEVADPDVDLADAAVDAHEPGDARRTNPGLWSDDGHPYHDIMLALDGEAARVVGDWCRERWRRATDRSLDPPAASDAGDLPDIDQLRADGELPIGPLRLDIHVYSDNPTERFVFINMRKYKEGDKYDEAQFRRYFELMARKRGAAGLARAKVGPDGELTIIYNPVLKTVP